MDKHAHLTEDLAAAGGKNATSSITFDSVINLNDYAGKNVKLNIDQSVVERPGYGKGGAEIVSAKENIKMTENGKPVVEHVLNDLTLTEKGRSVHLSDHTFVNAANPRVLERGNEPHAHGSHNVPDEPGKDWSKSEAELLPKLAIHDHSKH
jgi:hypothetical protein